MNNDFFGHNLTFSEDPVDLDVEKIIEQQQQLPYVDLSKEGSYTTTKATVVGDGVRSAYVPPQSHSRPQTHRPRYTELISQAAWGVGAGATIWLIGNLAIASRSGHLDDVRVYHLNLAGGALSVLVALGGAAAAGVKKKLEN